MAQADITEWHNRLIQLPDRTFFSLIRLYLGEISTPFNKQRLVERLSGFLHKPDIQALIVQALDRIDIFVLTAVHTLPDTTRRSLLCFFSSDFYIHARLINMEERLLLYTVESDDDDGEKIYKINPLLMHVLEPLLDKNVFFLPEKRGAVSSCMTYADDIVLAGLYTFFLQDSDVLKKDGGFKRKIVRSFDSCFSDIPDSAECMNLLCTGLRHLGLYTVSESNIFLHENRWVSFFSQKAFERKMYLAAAVCGAARRRIVQRRAVILSTFFSHLEPGAGYTDDTLKQIYYYILQQIGRDTYPSDDVLLKEVPKSGQSFMLIDVAKGLGFLLEQKGLWSVNMDIFSEPKEHQPVIVSPSFELTILPHTAIHTIFSLLAYLEPVSIQQTGRFEITRAACARCFEKNTDAAFFIQALKKASGNTVPQNIVMTVTDWYAKYTAIGLYHGFVLCVAEEKRALFKQNSELNGLIYKELAEGVFLLNGNDECAIRTVLKSAGLDCTFYQQDSQQYAAVAAFQPVLYENKTVCIDAQKYTDLISQHKIREDGYYEHKRSLEQLLEKDVFSTEEQRRLAEKIDRKLIISPAQLTSASLDSDGRGVSALDFLGKLRMAETAIATKTLLEVSFDADDRHHLVIGLPVRLEKNGYDAVLILQIKMSGVYEKISLARISKMNSLRDSLFS